MRRRFWTLLGIVAALHAYNMYLDSKRVPEPDLPDGATRRLPDGGLLMADGSIAQEEGTPAHGHTLHKVKEVEADELVLDRAWRKLKETV